MAGEVTAQDEPAGYHRMRRMLTPVAASWLILLASFVNFLRYNGYPLLRPEVGLLALAMLVLAGIVGFIHSTQRALGQAVLDMLLVFLIVNQNGGGFIYSAAACAIVGGVTLYRRRSILPLIGLAAAIALVSGLAGIGQHRGAGAESGGHVQPPPASRPRPPVLVHIILDEHLGIEGFSRAGAGGEALQRELQAFYLSHGFRLFGRAYAEQFHTVNSIPQMLNFGAVLQPVSHPFDGRSFRRNAYFDALAARGYRLTVYQSNYIGYCGNPSVWHCVTYDPSGLSAIDHSSLTIPDRAAIILTRLALLSDIVRALKTLYVPTVLELNRKGYDLPDFGLATEARTTPLNAADAFDRLIADLRRAQPGDAYFAHILLPHDPYELRPDCTARPFRQWQIHDPTTSISRRQAAYLDQVRCALRKVDAAYAALSHSSTGQRFIMIVHGDHGSRVTSVNPTVENIGKFGSDDLVAGFTTLFAIRAPDIAPGYEQEPIAVPRLLEGLARSGFTIVPQQGDAAPYVTLDDESWIPRRRFPFLKSW